MIATVADRSSLPFHLGLTEPIDETTIAAFPVVEGAYDPVEQIWRLPDGMPLTDPGLSPKATPFTFTQCAIEGHVITDDGHVD
jgi:hypothetical protein